MAAAPERALRRVVLVGAGHAHLLALKVLARRPRAFAVTLVSDAEKSLYSGMAPGCVAGLWSRAALELDPRRFLREGDSFVLAKAVGIDRAARRLLCADGAAVPFDLLSLNVGSAPAFDASACRRTLAVKPLANFLTRIEAAFADKPPASAIVVGAGAAGAEIACALHARGAGRVTLVDRGALLGSAPPALRDRLQAKLARLGVALREDLDVTQIGDGEIRCGDESLAADLVVVATGGRPPAWLQGAGLALEPDGSIATRDTLQAEDDDDVFAVGDCGHVRGQVYAKAGVYAVRQAPFLARNLAARAAGSPLESWRAQADFLALLNTCDGAALGARNGVAFEGRWVRWLKDWIDRGFVASLA